MKHEERDLERRCVQLARRHGWDAWKNENNGNKGIPDHSFLKDGRFVMVEFKRSATARIRPEQLTTPMPPPSSWPRKGWRRRCGYRRPKNGASSVSAHG